MPQLGAPELLIILLIAVLLLGVGRLGRLGGELGKGIREFRKGLEENGDGGEPEPSEPVTEAAEEE